ncbi:translation initiation factor eIF4A [Actinomortierella ambigua]|uniref:Translation initiation factor eIF4A n=1 Tax=Actinomortierella ambigua TaxID=1343610 RepID=A0A9P6UAJ1_9FUNG|nr:translation initiation factor eIF4A [Actinomortierella ambigua]
MDTPITARPASAPPRTGDAIPPAPASSGTRPAKNSKGSNPSTTSDSTTSPSPSGSRKSKSGTPKGSPSPLRRSRPQDKQGDGANSVAASDGSSSTTAASVGLGVSTGTTIKDTSTGAQDTPRPPTSKGPGSVQTNSGPSVKSANRKEKQQQTSVPEPSASAGPEGVARENGSTKPAASDQAPVQAGTNETSDTAKAAAPPPLSSSPATSAKGAAEDVETDSKKGQKLTSARSQKVSAKPRKSQQQPAATTPGTSEQKARADNDTTASREPVVDATPGATPSTLSGAASPSVDDTAGGSANKKRKDKRKPTKRGSGLASGGDETLEAPLALVETPAPSEASSTMPQRTAKHHGPKSTAILAAAAGGGGEANSNETTGKSTSEPPTKGNGPTEASPSTGGDPSDASGAPRASSPRPGRGGKATTKPQRPPREKPERPWLQPTGGAATTTSATEERRPARSTPRSNAKESSTPSLASSSAKDTTVAAPDMATEGESSRAPPPLNERPVRERGPRATTMRQQRTEESASSRMATRERPAFAEGIQRRHGEAHQGGSFTDTTTRERFSDRGGRSTRGGGAGAGVGSSLSRVSGARNGPSSLDARSARQEAIRRERELRQQQQQEGEGEGQTKPDGETQGSEADQNNTATTIRDKEPSARPPRLEAGPFRQPSTTEPVRGGGPFSKGAPTSSAPPAARKDADGHGSWREIKAPGMATSRFGPSTSRPLRPERKEGFGTGPRITKDGLLANSMICYMTWEEMKLRPDVIERIHRNGLKRPSNVQKLALVPFGEGKDIIAQAQSQNDRTNTFAIGALQKLKRDVKRCQAVVICSDAVQPQQVFKDLERWFEGSGLSCVMLNETSNEELERLYGSAKTTTNGAAAVDHPSSPQVAVTTLGRLTEVMDQGLLETSTVDTVGICMAQHEIVDFEAFKNLWPKLSLSREAQVVVMTGIMLRRLRQVKTQYLRPNALVLRADELTLKWSDHYVIRLDSPEQRWPTLVEIFQRNKTISHTVIVTPSHSVTQNLVSQLKELGVPAHGIWSMADKVQMAELFNKPGDCVLVVESVLTAELDLDHDSLVINYEIPWKASFYMSTFGLFGRSGLRTMMINLLLKSKPTDSAMLEELETQYDIKIAEMELA